MTTNPDPSADEKAIVDVAIRYCYALDTRQWAELNQVFLPDATAELAETHHVGLDDIVSRCSSALNPLDGSQHIVSNHQVVLNGNEATHRCYLHAQHVRASADGGSNFVVGGRYEDDLVRTTDGWRIKHRRLVVMWTEGNNKVVRRGLGSGSA